MQARQEYKISINHSDYLLLRTRLRALLAHDGHVGPNGTYRIHSLYFDTPKDTALREKIDGVDRREKFRLRRYGDNKSSLDFIRLEKKSKIKGNSFKDKEPVTAQEVQQLLEGELSWMLDERRPLVLELYTKMLSQGLRPRVIISYEREPFVYAPGNVRVTLDRSLRTSRYATDFLALNTPTIPVGDGTALLEVKYDQFLPSLVAQAVGISNRRASAFSKYAAGRVHG